MEFELWSAAHAAALALLIVCMAGIIGFRRKLRQPRAKMIFRIGLALILIACEVSLQIWYVRTDNWNVYSFPFQLCSLMVLLAAVQLLVRHRGLGDIVFFLGLLGAIQAMLTPNLEYTFPSFRYYHFFIAHIAIIATCVYIAAVERYRPTLRSVGNALLWLHLLAIPAAVTNTLANTNYMFLARKPSTASMLDMLAPWPWYLLQLELVAIALCMLLLGIMRLIIVISKRRK